MGNLRPKSSDRTTTRTKNWPCTLCTHSHSVNSLTDSTNSQPAATIPRVGGAIVLSGRAEQGVSVVLFLHPNELILSNRPDTAVVVKLASRRVPFVAAVSRWRRRLSVTILLGVARKLDREQCLAKPR